MTRAIVIGAGIIGAACAWALAKVGMQVGVVDPRPIGSGTTAAGMGHLVVIDDPPAEFALTHLSMKLWEELVPQMTMHAEYSRCGTLWVAEDEAEMDEARAKHERLSRAGIEVQLLDPAGLARTEPNLRTGLAGGLRIVRDGLVYPPLAARWMLDAAGASGSNLHLGTPVASIAASKVTLADGRTLEADIIVNAAGLDARELTPGLPLRARKGHLIITDRYPGFCSNQIVELGYIKNAHGNALESVAFNLQPRPNGQMLLGSSRQFDVEELSIQSSMLSKVIARGCRFMPGLAQLQGIRAWTGLRAATPDGMPIIGPVGGMPGVFVAAGHEGLGITTATGTGLLIASMATGSPPPIDPTPYRVQRFSAGAA